MIRYTCAYCGRSVRYIDSVITYGHGFSEYHFCNQACHQEWIDANEASNERGIRLFKVWGIRILQSGALTAIAYIITH